LSVVCGPLKFGTQPYSSETTDDGQHTTDSQEMKKFYLTTPIYYPNARPHVGSAYTTIVCDAIARYKRMCGYDVAFLTGTDEHGEKLQRAADVAGIPVEQFVAEKRELFKDLWRTLGIPQHSSEHPAGYRFVHTSQNPAHRTAVQWMIRQAGKAGYIEKKRYEGRYCVFDERYVSDNPEPVNCDICGRPAELISEENYFFRLSVFQDRLLRLYKDQPEFVLPDFRMNEVKSFVKGGLHDISISRRRLKWGIPWPDDPEQVVYVWYDALTSYLTGIGFEGDKRSKDFEKYWMGAEGPSEVVHMIGKDILRFHAVYWPAFLMAAGLPLPKTVFAHGWIYYQQDKMSKSKGNVVYPDNGIADGRGLVLHDKILDLTYPAKERARLGNEALRYYLLRDTPFGLDGSFSYEGLIQRYNSDLANGLGNLAKRTLPMIRSYFDGIAPSPVQQQASDSETGSLLPRIASQSRTYAVNRLASHEFSTVLTEIWRLISGADRELNERRPWAITDDPSQRDRRADVLGNAYEVLRFVAVLAYPVLPLATQQLWTQLNQRECAAGVDPRSLQWGQLKPGTIVGKAEPIFPRLDKEATLRKLRELADEDRAREKNTKEASIQVESQSEQKPVAPVSTPASGGAGDSAATDQKITIDNFAKIDLRVGTILSAEPIPGATKLLKLQVDIGTEVRQVCAGIAEYYKPEDLVGMKIVLVANLQPRKLRGVESNGMILAASVGEQGKPVLATFKEEVPNGTKLK